MTQTALDERMQIRELDLVKAEALKMALENYRIKKLFKELELALMDRTNTPALGRARALKIIREAIPRLKIAGFESQQ